ncbi:hypothetical protein [Streptomyces anulatus]|uniref:hypothetical protein n=1 Tax=Streptomyces anulatus TaxID=1892 RepID=UPI002E13227F|nr:hypothetical protein OG557_39160 [Streptomyces anulatus]
MSTESFHLAPGQPQQTGATTYAPTPSPAPTTPAAATKAPSPRTSKTNPGTPTLAGAVIPAAALTGFISLCWLIHQFGLPAVLLGIAAVTAASAAALVLKSRKGTRKVSKARKAAVMNAGGGGSGRTVLGPGKQRGGGSLKPSSGGSPSAGGGGRRNGSKSSGLPKSKSGPGPVKPTKNTVPKNDALARAPKNTTPKNTSRLSRKSAALGGPNGGTTTSKPTPPASPRGNTLKTLKPSRLVPSRLKPSPKKQPQTQTKPTKAPNGKGKHAKPTTPTSAPAGRSGLLNRIKNRKTPAPAVPQSAKKKATRTKPLKPIKPLKKAKNTAARKGKKATTAFARKLAKAAKANKKTRGPKTPKPQHLKTKSKKPLSPKKATRRKAKGKKTKLVRNRPVSYRARLGRMRRTTYLAGVKARKHINVKTRMRIRKVTSPGRVLARRTNRLLSPPLATLWRYGTRSLLAAHMALGTVRYTHAGPNWTHPLAAVLHTITTPAARMIHATGAWTWLNRWMYQHTAPTRTTTAPTTPTTPAPTAGPALTGQIIPPRPEHDPIITPGTTTIPEGTPVTALPLQQAEEAVTQAGLMLLTNPAENMVDYEATLKALSGIQSAIGEALQKAAETTRENFKVNPAVAEAYDDSAGYAAQLADRVAEIPILFRSLHEEQIENIENPTHQARKWDIAANE